MFLTERRPVMSEPISQAVDHLDGWINSSGWVGYDPFDGLSTPFARKLTFEIPLLRIFLLQSVRRLPMNIRPLLGITRKYSTKAMGYFAKGYLSLFRLTGNKNYLDKAIYCLSTLKETNSKGYAGYAWGNAFDYQARGVYLPQGTPHVVWSSFISYAFLEAYEILHENSYLDVARSSCDFILHNLGIRRVTEQSVCISYVPNGRLEIHNANMLAASLLARVYKHTGESKLLDLACLAVKFTMDHQRPDGSWYYGEGLRWHWVDGYHTGFVLDALYWYIQSTGDLKYEANLQRGMDYYRKNLFSGIKPKHYVTETYPIDIQTVAQAIQTFAFLPKKYSGDLDWSEQVATWAIDNMQDPSGYFYFRKLRFIMNKTPFLHWGQSTMLAALALLLQQKRAATELVPDGDEIMDEK
jgi:rhamnogalacturonyl hydrolase YesR